MNTKLIVALVIVGVLAVAVVGLVAAQVVTSTPSPNGTTANGGRINGFLEWMGRCLGFRRQAYQGQPANITITNPYTNQTSAHQGYRGYGGCVRGFFP